MPEPIAVETPCGTWPVDLACCDDWDDFLPSSRQRALTLAVNHLWRVTGRRFGLCEITILPCREDCAQFTSTYRGLRNSIHGLATGQSVFPVLDASGGWRNCFGCATCFCDDPSMLKPPTTPVQEIIEILVDGVAISLDGFKILDGTTIVAPEGFRFPACQHISRPPTEEGTWAVTYTYGISVPEDGAHAAGAYACELAKACEGKKCELPRRTQTVVRQGITQTLVNDAGFLQDGLVGLADVDAFIVSVNPYGLSEASRVYSPDDVMAGRSARVTWPL